MASASQASSAWEDELMLLDASYGKELHVSVDKTKAILMAVPHFDEDSLGVFASATIEATVTSEYPSKPAAFKLESTRGLDDARRRALVESLDSLARDSAGFEEVHVAVCFLAAADYLTEHNKPDDCPVCLEGFDTDAAGGERMMELQPCLHVLHVGCFKGYRKILSERREEKKKLLVGREGPAKAERLARERWAICPVCRAEFDCAAADLEVKKR